MVHTNSFEACRSANLFEFFFFMDLRLWNLVNKTKIVLVVLPLVV